MKPPIHQLILASLLCVLSCTQAQSQKATIAPAPAWVNPSSYDLNETFGEQDAEDGYLDLAFERQISAVPYSVYSKKVLRILTQAGIENISKVTVNYDPTYQQLVFHTVKVIRGNQVINQLNQAKIKTIQQEKGIDRNLYDGSLTAMLILDDLRKGDVIEYSYTIKGDNPVFKGKISESFDLDYIVPVCNLYFRLISPSGRALVIKTVGKDSKPEIIKSGSNDIYEWKLKNIAAVRMQDHVPGWYDPYSYVMLSEYKNWQEVNDWALQLFPDQHDLSVSLKKKIEEIRSANTTLEDQVGAALRFVQDEVRYMGIEVGANSHQPVHPDKIFTQRYGDCKDKTYLLCTMLKALGAEAYPVLINTYGKKVIEGWPAAADVFNHATVKAVVNGKEYWFDPTISFQRGSIGMISYPDYQVGLVVAPGTTSLTKIGNKEPGKVDVEETFDIKDMNGDARLLVTTRYTGKYADDVRSSFHESSRYEILKNYQEYYATFHEDIKGDSVSYTDNEKTGEFIVKEYYTVENLWEVKNGQKKAIFSPYMILGLLKTPSDKKRKMPFALTYPLKYREQVIIKTPEYWGIDDSKDYIETDAFTMKARFDQTADAVVLTYDYETLQDFVAPEKTRQFTDAVDSIENHLSFHLTDYVNEKPAVNKTPVKPSSTRNLYIALAVMAIAGMIVWRVTRNR
ncbi:MAG: hypothetical protein DI535_16295 [Citrobacter freundii]|nr:MAG: hypothetical protein DI535_16295 [Citrobacter freundii]